MTKLLALALATTILGSPVAAGGMPTPATLFPPFSMPAPDSGDGSGRIVATRGR
ncbi:hypothetical protein [Jannaschia marina]|uniref:hypothetical protein n=1 Tax=Jannaschia marina TaxID=2741674 RepID=UPI0015CA22FB|nr:hypothetical protein [Jannaschia marina]